VLGRLRRSFTDRAVLLITYRMAAAQIADRVVVLEHGSIIEQGAPADLLAVDGPFAKLPNTDPAVRACASLTRYGYAAGPKARVRDRKPSTG
jgi:ABC-type transport system involved in cytochrome bd biosynthesis fused ATPase/permease subunit